MGIEFKESSYNLNAKCSKTMKTDMILSLNIGFENIPDPKSKGGGVYALLLADTIRVTENASLLLSDGIKSGKEVFFSLDDEANPKANGSGKSAPPKRGGARTQSAVMKTKLRQKDTGQSAQAERRRQHQAELAAKKQLDGELKYKDGAGTGQVKEKQWKRFESYQRENQLPDESRALEVRSLVPPHRSI
jgi:nucleosome binding factor SPN SPT16 subunit